MNKNSITQRYVSSGVFCPGQYIYLDISYIFMYEDNSSRETMTMTIFQKTDKSPIKVLLSIGIAYGGNGNKIRKIVDDCG